jgi:hypothetical protein
LISLVKTTLGFVFILPENTFFGDVVDYVDLLPVIMSLIADIRPQTIPFSNR